MRLSLRLSGLVVLLALGVPVKAQRGIGGSVPPRGIHPLPPSSGGMRPSGQRPLPRLGRPWGWGGGWGGGWGDGWWNSSPGVQVPQPLPEFIAPNAIVNKDYKPEKLSPEMTEYPAGALSEPRALREPLPLPPGSCRVAFQDGGAEDAQACRLDAGLVVYLSARGTIKRVSLELVDLDRSALP
jgi:hypothetical protein